MSKKFLLKSEAGKVCGIVLVLCALALAAVIGVGASGLEPDLNNDSSYDLDYIWYYPY